VNVSDAIQRRRSVSLFDPAYKISDAEVRELVEAANLSPSAFNIQHWRFVWLRDPAVLGQASEAVWFQPQVTDAALVLLVCLDLKAWQKSPERYWANAPAEVAKHMIDNTLQTYADNPQLERDEAMRSASMAAMTLMLKAQDMGLESCAMACDEQRMADIVKLPEDHALCMVIAFGRALKPPYARPGLLSVEDVLVTDSF
jgi:nitroreductase